MNTGSYVNGKWYQPASKKISKNINPADTSDVIAEFPLATAADVRSAIDAAVAARPAWEETAAPAAAPGGRGGRRGARGAGACGGAPPISPGAASTRSPRP